MDRFKKVMFAVFITAVFAGMIKAAEKKIIIESSTTVLPIAQMAAEKFMEMNPEASITVRGGGSGVGIASLIDGTCVIAAASRAMKDVEMQKAVGRGRDPKAHIIAMDGIAIIVNPSNPINALSKAQIKEIYKRS